MSDTYTAGLRLQVPTVGGDSGVWGTTLNTDLSLLDTAITGVSVIYLNNQSTYTIVTANGAADQARAAVWVFSGTLSGNCTVTVPQQARIWTVINQCSGGNILLTTGTGGSVTVINNSGMSIVRCDGTSMYAQSIQNPITTSSDIFTLGLFRNVGFAAVVTTGQTLNVTNQVVINPAGTLAALTVKLPSAPAATSPTASSTKIDLLFMQAITALTWTGFDSTPRINPPSSTTAGHVVSIFYDQATASYYFSA